MSDQLKQALATPEIQHLLSVLTGKLHTNIPLPDDPKARLEVLQGYIASCACVFLDGPGFIERRGPQYIYESVATVLRAHESESHAFIEQLREFYFHKNLAEIPEAEQSEDLPFWGNSWFTHADARCLYATIARFRPKRVVEIGSGNSTRFARKAIRDFGLSTVLTCIDPQPRAAIKNIADKIIQASLLHAPEEIFAELESGDILFLDGSHLVFNGTDCTRFFLDILPKAPPGLLVQVHDILLPYEYNEDFSKLYFAEQYLLAAQLIYSTDWIPLWGSYYFSKTGMHADLMVPPGGQSFWMRRR